MDGRGPLPMRTILLVAGILCVAAAVLWPILSRWVGRLPGDITVRKGPWTFAFPIVTCLLLSFLLSLFFALFRR